MDLTGAAWHKSTRSQSQGSCVEIAVVQGHVAVRDSKDPSGPALVFTPAEWAAFLDGVHKDEFEL
ncbi:MAG: DUF397 domain-containing protein [Micromonosporaceae bacterium]